MLGSYPAVAQDGNVLRVPASTEGTCVCREEWGKMSQWVS